MARGAPDFYLTAITAGFIVMTPQGPVVTTQFGGTCWRLDLEGNLIPPSHAMDSLDPHWSIDQDGNLVPKNDLAPVIASFWDVDTEGNLVPPV